MSERDDEERKRRHAERERERQRRARELGLTRKQARSLKKTLAENPSLLPKIAELAPGLANQVERIIDTTVKTWEDGQFVERPLRKVFFRKPAPRPRKKLSERERKQRREEGNFKAFVRRHPEMSERKLVARWRELGHSIGNNRAAELVREARGAKKNEEKVQRFPTLAYGTVGTPLYLKNRYNYVVSFQVATNASDEPVTRYLTIGSDRKLTRAELRDEIYRAFDAGEADTDEFYTAVALIEDDEGNVIFRVEYMVDREKKTKEYRELEKEMAGRSPADIAIEYRRRIREQLKKKKRRK